MEAIFAMILCDTDILIEFYKNSDHILPKSCKLIYNLIDNN
jgi:hypothetical protein